MWSRRPRRLFLWEFPSFLLVASLSTTTTALSCSRRSFWTATTSASSLLVATTASATLSPSASPSAETTATTNNKAPHAQSSTNASRLFQSSAYGTQEYTNSITASRDTNVSPAEAYDVLRQHVPAARSVTATAVDVGAGAGVSTTLLVQEKGYRQVAAVDWSRTAWDAAVVVGSSNNNSNNNTDDGVIFYESDDSTFFASQTQHPRYDCIVYNFAINPQKAVTTAQSHLTPDGVLLAPVNDKVDYWYKQSYVLLNHHGTVVWKSDPDVGAWSIQFQPDVTAPTCTGIWCGSVNGFLQ